jgi:hypothetical protein
MRSSHRLFSHDIVFRDLARFVAAAALLCVANLPRPLAAQTWAACGSGYVLCTVTSGARVGIGTLTPSATLGLNNSLASISDFPTATARQVEINDVYTNTSAGQDATVSIYSQAAATANSSSADISLLINNKVPSTETVNFGNKFGIKAESSFYGSGSVGNIMGAQFFSEFGGATTAPFVVGAENSAGNGGSGTATLLAGAYNLSGNGTGTVTNAYGSFNEVDSIPSGGTIGSAYALYADVYKTNGTITNAYGLYLGPIGGTNHYGIYQSDNSINYFAGNVGIGVTNPVSKLAVNGTISASEVVVTSTPADYVFDRDYRLAPLSEVADYISANHHLPEIPSGAEVQEKGVSLGEMQSKLLAKIEELTLHMIQAEQENQALRKRVALLEKRADK